AGAKHIKLPYIPQSMIPNVMAAYHDHPSSGHFGIKRAWYKLKDRYFWPNMMSTITNYIRSCHQCAKFNIRRRKLPGKLHPIRMESLRLSEWTFGVQRLFHRHKTIAVPNNSATTTAQFIVEEVILKYGVPRKIITDQGTHFKNELMEKIALLMGFKHAFATTYHPQTNGQVERFNATFYPQLA
ncbi:unnamed protein product, partial [Didymodactylos carnosus]